MRLEPVQNIEEQASVQVLTEAKVFENKDQIIPKEKKEEPKFHAHLFSDQSKQTYMEKIAPMLAEKIPEPKRGLITNKSVDFLIGKYDPGKFNQTYVSTVRDLTKHGMNSKQISDLVQHTYGNLPSHLAEKVEKELGQPQETVSSKDPQSPAQELAEPQEKPPEKLKSEQPVLESNEVSLPLGAAITPDPKVNQEKAPETLTDLKKEPAVDLGLVSETGKELNQLRNQMALDQAREVTSRRQQTTLAEVRELSEELARIRRELILQRVDEVKDQMLNVLKDAANGAKNFSVAVASWVKEVAGHIGELTREAIEKFKNNSSVAEYATLFKAAIKEPEKYMKGKELYDRDYDAVEKKLQESSGTTEKPPRLLVRLYANSLAYQA